MSADGDIGVEGAAIASPEDLVVRTADKDQAAFGELYDRFAPRVLGLIVKVLVDRAQSEEVCQEVFLEIWNHASSFDPARGSALAWMLTMTHRRAVDRVRSSQAGHDRDERIGRRDLEPEFDQVSEQVEIRVEHERVARAMAKLTPVQREAIGLAYYGGRTQQEISGILSVPLGTVKTRLRDGLIRLRDELGVTS